MWAAGSCSKSSSAACSPAPLCGRHPLKLAVRRARRAARDLGLLLDCRNEHDGAEPLPAEAPRRPRPRRRKARLRPAGADPSTARRDPARQQPRQRGCGDPGVGHHDPALRRKRDRARHRHAAGHVPDPRVLRDHAEGGWRSLRRARRAAARLRAGAVAQALHAGGVVREPVRGGPARAHAHRPVQGQRAAATVDRRDPHAGARVGAVHAQEAPLDPREPL